MIKQGEILPFNLQILRKKFPRQFSKQKTCVTEKYTRKGNARAENYSFQKSKKLLWQSKETQCYCF